MQNTKRTIKQTGRSAILKLSLNENTYGFLNQSLKHYRKSSRNHREWPFALLHIVQALELMLKQVLVAIHPVMIFKNIDEPSKEKHTVSLEQALTRLETLGVPISEKERINIRKAALHRNRIVHYETEFNRFEWQTLYAQLFEFAHFFHHKHLKGELHSHISHENWPVEAKLMRFFRENFVMYQGSEVPKDYPAEIISAQKIAGFFDGETEYYRIRYGKESGCTVWRYSGL